MDDALAQEGEDRGCAGNERGRTAEHEGEGSCAGADDAAGHGGVEKCAGCVGFGVDEGSDGAGCRRVDGGAVDEEALR